MCRRAAGARHGLRPVCARSLRPTRRCWPLQKSPTPAAGLALGHDRDHATRCGSCVFARQAPRRIAAVPTPAGRRGTDLEPRDAYANHATQTLTLAFATPARE